MRQGQQNRRGRGRNNNNNSNNNNNNNNRKSQNPLTRSFESNGPDVKIRGTPSHIAEKYISLARDAQSSGDPVLAENYLQHAEHYNRIIMAYREQQIQHGGDPGVAMVRRPQMSGEFVDGDEFDEDGDENGNDAGGQPIMGANEPQPMVRNFDAQRHEGGRHEGGRQDYRGQRNEGRQDSGNRDNRDNRDNRNDGRRGDFHLRRERQPGNPRDGDRGQHGGQPRGDYRQDPRHERRPAEGGQFEPREPRGEGRPESRPEHRPESRPEGRFENRQDARPEPRPEGFVEPRLEARAELRPEPRVEGRPEGRPESRPESRGEPRPDGATPRRESQPRQRRDQFGAGSEQPEFLRRPVRRPRREAPVEEGAAAAPAPVPAATVDDSAE